MKNPTALEYSATETKSKCCFTLDKDKQRNNDTFLCHRHHMETGFIPCLPHPFSYSYLQIFFVIIKNWHKESISINSQKEVPYSSKQNYLPDPPQIQDFYTQLSDQSWPAAAHWFQHTLRKCSDWPFCRCLPLPVTNFKQVFDVWWKILISQIWSNKFYHSKVVQAMVNFLQFFFLPYLKWFVYYFLNADHTTLC